MLLHLRRSMALFICPELDLQNPDGTRPASQVWEHGRRPAFWGDKPVLMLLTDLHREVTLKEAREICSQRFGPDRTPSRSALNRFWLRLDAQHSARRAA